MILGSCCCFVIYGSVHLTNRNLELLQINRLSQITYPIQFSVRTLWNKWEVLVHRQYLVSKNLKTPQADLFLTTNLSHLKQPKFSMIDSPFTCEYRIKSTGLFKQKQIYPDSMWCVSTISARELQRIQSSPKYNDGCIDWCMNNSSTNHIKKICNVKQN